MKTDENWPGLEFYLKVVKQDGNALLIKENDMKAKLWKVVFGNNAVSIIVNAKNLEDAIKKSKERNSMKSLQEKITKVVLLLEED